MQDIVSANHVTTDPVNTGGDPSPLDGPSELALPWVQLGALRRMPGRPCGGQVAYPRVQLRGEKSRLRALRAAEMAAWEAFLSPGA
jgi:hypothetical protein